MNFANLTLAGIVAYYRLSTTYIVEQIESMTWFAGAAERNKSKDKCRWPGCHSKPQVGKVYCRRHVQSQ